MPRLSKEFSAAIEKLSHKDLIDIVKKSASKSQEIYRLIEINYFGDEDTLEKYFEETKNDVALEVAFIDLSGAPQNRIAKAIGKAIKLINEYVKVAKNPVHEAELLNIVLERVFTDYSRQLGTCFTVFDSKVAVTLRRFHNLVLNKLHEDYHIQYADSIDSYIKSLKATSRFLDSVYGLPDSFHDIKK